MLVDINQFKRINAQWGHRVGDKVLVSIVDIIQQSIRPDDILARLEGEVFGLLFTELIVPRQKSLRNVCVKMSNS